MEDKIKEYYGKILKKSTDLKTDACCTIDTYPDFIKDCMNNIEDEILSTYYGCGLVIPDCLDKCNILDLGCGSGRDIYILSQLVGKDGKVTGIDMTQEQLDIALKYKKIQAEKIGYDNTNFIKGYIENLGMIKNDEMDLVISNCVINLSLNKKMVLQEIFRVLKTGGELYFSDVYSSRRIPEELKNDEVLWGECLSGALYWNDFYTLIKEIGFKDARIVKYNKIEIKNKKIQEKLEDIDFFSVTYRLFKLPNLLEYDCEDYGQAISYKGSIKNNPKKWSLDDHHVFETNKIYSVCGNTWNMLNQTRYKNHFNFIGNFNKHYGIFPGCGKNIPFLEKNKNMDSNCC